MNICATCAQAQPDTHETMVRNWSIRGAWGIDFRGYLGLRERRRVLGRWKETEYRTLRAACACVPWSAAFLAALAFASLAGAITDDEHGRRKRETDRQTHPSSPYPWESSWRPL